MYLGKSGLVGYSALIFFNETGTENGMVYSPMIARGTAMNGENTEQLRLDVRAAGRHHANNGRCL